jgi:hypothetical protein
MSDNAGHPVPRVHRWASEGLGNLIETFRPSWVRVAFGAVFALVVLGVGLQIAVRFTLGWVDLDRVENAENPFLERWGTAAFGLVVAAGGCGLLFYVWHIGSHRVYVREAGLVRVRRRQRNTFRWAEIVEVQERLHSMRLIDILGPLSPTMTSTSYVVVRRDNVMMMFDADAVREADRLAELIRWQCAARGIPWRVSEDAG